MIIDYVRALFIHRGLDPRLVDDLPMQDIANYLAIEDLLAARDQCLPLDGGSF